VSTDSLAKATACCRSGARYMLEVVECIQDMGNNTYFYDTTRRREMSEMLTEQHGWLLHWFRVLNEHADAGWDTSELCKEYNDFNENLNQCIAEMRDVLDLRAPAGKDPDPGSDRILRPGEFWRDGEILQPGQVSRSRLLQRKLLIATIALGYAIIVPAWIIADSVMDPATEQGLMTLGIIAFFGWSLGAMIMWGQYAAEERRPELAKVRHAANAAFGVYVAVKVVESIHNTNERLKNHDYKGLR
jgi:hypothetical protein